MNLTALSVGVSLAVFALLQGLARAATGGAFEYPLDDVYIHLAIGNAIWRGEYGVNPGEYASAASSILYPMLLAPFSGSVIERFIPLAINLAALVAAAVLWARILQQSRAPGGFALLAAALGPVGINLAGSAFTGMEHALHVAATLAVFSGLIAWIDMRRVTWLLVIGIVAGPMLRLEGLAPSLLACGVLALTGGWRPSLALIVGALAPVVAFSLFLSAHGIGPLPTSVLAKQGLSDGSGSFLHRLVENASAALVWPTAWPVLIVALGLLITALAVRANRLLALVLAAAAGVGFGHILLGRFGWGFRYETYVMAALASGLVLALARLTPDIRRQVLAGILVLGGTAALIQPEVLVKGPGSVRAVHLQHAVMARFVRDRWDAPVAVNDIGRVTWCNPNYVLDLYGLASRQAFLTRTDPNRPDGWAGEMAMAQNAQIALVYDYVFPRGFAPPWRMVAKLHTEGPLGWIAVPEVTIYAGSDWADARVRYLLTELQADLPDATWVKLLP